MPAAGAAQGRALVRPQGAVLGVDVRGRVLAMVAAAAAAPLRLGADGAGALLALPAAGASSAAQRSAGAPEPGGDDGEPPLQEVVRVAMRIAAGSASDDASRTERLRASHWAPVLRAQGGLRDDQRTRRGEVRLAPLLEDDAGTSRAWAVVLQWDFAQLVYSREESQLALAQVHLARVRRQAAAEAAGSYAERFRRRAQLRALGPARASERAEAALALLRATAQLDALTAGLYRRQLEAAQALLDELASPPAGPAPAPRSGFAPSAAPGPLLLRGVASPGEGAGSPAGDPTSAPPLSGAADDEEPP